MRILITGGGSDIGRAIAERNLKAGHEVFFTASTEGSLAKTVSDYKARKLAAKGFVFQLGGKKAFASQLEKEFKKGFDAIVLNAASSVKELSLFHETSLLEVEESIDQNILGNLRIIQAALPKMIENKMGRLVFISSVTVPMGSSRYGTYNLTKGAIESLFFNLAVDYGPYGILSNIVRPGTIQTERTKRFWSREKYVERIARIIPQGKMGLPEQVAECLDPLLSATSYMNGSIVTVSGGFPLVKSERL